MTSFSSKIITSVIRLTRKNSYASAQSVTNRVKNERQRENHSPPRSMRSKFNLQTDMAGNRTIYTLRQKHSAPKIDILYFHGGGYLFEITRYHWIFLARLCRHLNARIVIPIYPLAPENNWRDVFEAIMPVYERMREPESSNPMVLMGDSAGGGLALAVSMQASKRAIAQPDHLVLLSPWVDLTMSNPAIAAVEPDDPWLSKDGVKATARLYAQGSDLRNYHLSPIYGDLSQLPPTSLFAGKHDILYPDSVALSEKARKAGSRVDLFLEEEMFHVWMLLNFAEARKTQKQIIALLQALPRKKIPAV